ncbi:MAG: hypothetical protein [Wendovervirus sonii]|uniref:Uncharacterized protein n=1 Tax=phage Lak_Megaphage_Sonny TaxID=3109229 RepID=A0ABZ0Z4D5_9CAUD|nr:MAG: hypothetical protein [phage Lak_Megaphage_Sonny]
MNKKKLYETLSHNISKSLDKLLNESVNNINQKVEYILHLFENYDDSEEDDRIDLDDALEDIEWDALKKDNKHFECEGSFRYHKDVYTFMGDFITVPNYDALDLVENGKCECWVNNEKYAGSSETVASIINYIISDGWGPSEF